MFIRRAKKLIIVAGMCAVFYFLFLLLLNINELDAHTKDQRIRYGAFKYDMDDMSSIVKWEKEQANRVHTMRETCRSLSPSTTPLSQWLKVHHAHLRHILVSDEYRTLYCYVPKAACTNWKKAFLYLNGMVKNEDEARLFAHKKKTNLAKYSEEEALFRLQNYSKFIFVRNPMSRILSGYREKFALSERRGRRNWSVNLGNVIHFQFSNHTLTNFKDMPSSGFNVSFREFVRF
ncbi:carbohydrate sulfotransferase 14-like [Amphiura filiformis]|uniref:carbohydrate sulfotransferase 14-like n=1 Tax=Amphiura filiformis TaxID=82378 RepID=UPI003B20D779